MRLRWWLVIGSAVGRLGAGGVGARGGALDRLVLGLGFRSSCLESLWLFMRGFLWVFMGLFPKISEIALYSGTNNVDRFAIFYYKADSLSIG